MNTITINEMVTMGVILGLGLTLGNLLTMILGAAIKTFCDYMVAKKNSEMKVSQETADRYALKEELLKGFRR